MAIAEQMGIVGDEQPDGALFVAPTPVDQLDRRTKLLEEIRTNSYEPPAVQEVCSKLMSKYVDVEEFHAPGLFDEPPGRFFDAGFYDLQLTDEDGEPERIEMPTDEVAEDRIRTIFWDARDVEHEVGQQWYPAAHAMCEKWLEQHPSGLSVEHVSGIVAALSPNQAWSLNIKMARKLLATGEVRGLGFAVRDAMAIYEGADPREVLYQEGRTNFKVRSFFENISDPSNPDFVTIDRHMIGILTDDAKSITIENRIKKSSYYWAVERFKTVAEEFGVLPNQLQATTWVAWRRGQGIIDRFLSGQLEIEFLELAES